MWCLLSVLMLSCSVNTIEPPSSWTMAAPALSGQSPHSVAYGRDRLVMQMSLVGRNRPQFLTSADLRNLSVSGAPFVSTYPDGLNTVFFPYTGTFFTFSRNDEKIEVYESLNGDVWAPDGRVEGIRDCDFFVGDTALMIAGTTRGGGRAGFLSKDGVKWDAVTIPHDYIYMAGDTVFAFSRGKSNGEALPMNATMFHASDPGRQYDASFLLQGFAAGSHSVRNLWKDPNIGYVAVLLNHCCETDYFVFLASEAATPDLASWREISVLPVPGRYDEPVVHHCAATNVTIVDTSSLWKGAHRFVTTNFRSFNKSSTTGDLSVVPVNQHEGCRYFSISPDGTVSTGTDGVTWADVFRFPKKLQGQAASYGAYQIDNTAVSVADFMPIWSSNGLDWNAIPMGGVALFLGGVTTSDLIWHSEARHAFSVLSLNSSSPSVVIASTHSIREPTWENVCELDFVDFNSEYRIIFISETRRDIIALCGSLNGDARIDHSPNGPAYKWTKTATIESSAGQIASPLDMENASDGRLRFPATWGFTNPVVVHKEMFYVPFKVASVRSMFIRSSDGVTWTQPAPLPATGAPGMQQWLGEAGGILYCSEVPDASLSLFYPNATTVWRLEAEAWVLVGSFTTRYTCAARPGATDYFFPRFAHIDGMWFAFFGAELYWSGDGHIFARGPPAVVADNPAIFNGLLRLGGKLLATASYCNGDDRAVADPPTGLILQAE